jgi:hypothetical protein
LGRERARGFHAHFCRIEYTQGGEKRHWTFADTQYGPDFALLAPLLVSGGWAPTIICESSGTMAEDACAMQAMVRRAADQAWVAERIPGVAEESTEHNGAIMAEQSTEQSASTERSTERSS